jgi:hypothetical protein
MLCLVLLFVLLAVTPRRKSSAPPTEKPSDDME